MIWGDQHDPRFFDFFLENNLLQHFTQFLAAAANRRGDVAKQVPPRMPTYIIFVNMLIEIPHLSYLAMLPVAAVYPHFKLLFMLHISPNTRNTTFY